MNEPTITQTLRAMAESRGSVFVVLSLISAYWKAIAAIASAMIAFGVFVDKFNTVIGSQQKTTQAIEGLSGRVEVLSSRVGELEKHAVKDDARWEAIHTAADIVVTSKPAPPPPRKKR